MSDHGADGFVCDHGEMLAWLTGYSVSETRYRACIVGRTGDPVWVLRTIDEGPCRRATWVSRLHLVADHEDPFAAVATVLENLNLANKTLAADYTSYGFTAEVHATLRRFLPEAGWVNMRGISDRIRLIKDADEIKQLRQAAGIADGAMAALSDQLRPGMRPRDAAAIAAQYYLHNGADDWWVGPIAISRRSGSAAAASDLGYLHQTLADEALGLGDILHVELVPRVNSYSARIMRSISLGAPAADAVKTMASLVSLQDRQIERLIPGAIAGEVDQLLRQSVLRAGLRTEFDNATGYQIGLYTKTPRSSDFSYFFHQAAEWRIEPGMTFHMYLSAQGLAVSDSILVTADGPERLTQTRRALLIAEGGRAPSVPRP